MMKIYQYMRGHLLVLNLYLTGYCERDLWVSARRMGLLLAGLIFATLSAQYAFEPFRPLSELSETRGKIVSIAEESVGYRGRRTTWRMVVEQENGSNIKFTVGNDYRVIDTILLSIGSDVTVHWQKWWLYLHPFPIVHSWEEARNISIDSEIVKEYRFEEYMRVRRTLRNIAMAFSITGIAILIYLNVMAWLQFGDIVRNDFSYEDIESKKPWLK